MHSLPYSEAITEDVYGDLFKSVGCNEDGVQHYFSFRADRQGKHPVLAFDSTTISTCSENQLEARRGCNKDGDGLNTIKLLTLYSVKDHEPLTFAKQPGNVPDVISIDSPDNDTRKQVAFRKDLLELKAQVEDGVAEFTKSAQRKIDRYLICSKKERGGQVKVGFNDKATTEAKKYFGYFALVSNQSIDTFIALEDYRLREKIEELFAVHKGGLTQHPDFPVEI